MLCHDGGIYHHHGRVGVATSDPSTTNEIQLVWSDNGLGEISKVLNAAELQVTSVGDQMAAVKGWCRKGGVFKVGGVSEHRGRVGVATADPDNSARVRLAWSDNGRGCVSEPIAAATLIIASSAEQLESVKDWCHAGGVYSYHGRVGVALADPNSEAEIWISWSGDGLGEISKVLNAAELQVASFADQLVAVKGWCRKGGAYKYKGRVGVALADPNSTAEIQLMYDGVEVSGWLQAAAVQLAPKIAQLTTEMMECASKEQYTRAIELQTQV